MAVRMQASWVYVPCCLAGAVAPLHLYFIQAGSLVTASGQLCNVLAPFSSGWLNELVHLCHAGDHQPEFCPQLGQLARLLINQVGRQMPDKVLTFSL